MTTTPDTDVKERLAELAATPFDRLPASVMMRAYGVYYGHVHTSEGGDLYVTRHGWPFLTSLLPENWFVDQWYAEHGTRLPGSTGHVYRVPTRPVDNKRIDLVAKFSRVGQEVPLVVADSARDNASHIEIANARFNSPLEEFGMVMEMRRGSYGPRDLRIMSQRPLAIFAPSEKYELWQLGRTHSRFGSYRNITGEDQRRADLAIELDIKREYVTLFSWIKGMDAEEAHIAGDLKKRELHNLTERVTTELSQKGFRVLDNKPKHYIVRRRNNTKQLMKRNDEVTYGLIDFELLQRTQEYERHFKVAQRAKYWQMQSHRLDRPPAWLPPHLSKMTIYGINFLHGTAPNSGKVWTVGNDPDLFDYFLPDRWRRTPRLQLAISNDVWRTRTRDSIHVVYRCSRVGQRPPIDPYYEKGRTIRQHGYNSPFEEIAIAEMLRARGISTIYPRAIYRTGHESERPAKLRDERRYRSHALLTTPDNEPILSPNYEYYTIWGYFRGVNPQKHYRRRGHWGFVDLEKAREDGVLSEPEYADMIASIRARLDAIGYPHETIEDFEFLLQFNEKGHLCRDDKNRLEATWSLDALAAFEYGLLNEAAYTHLIENMHKRLRDAYCEPLDLSGRHLLLSLNPDGMITPNEQGDPEATLCNFELIRGISCML